MKPNKINSLQRTIAAIALTILAAAPAIQAAPADASGGGVVSPVQSPADSYNLATPDPVMLAGSDAASQSFDKTVLPSLTSFVKANLPETVNNTKSAAFEVDPNNIVLANNTAVRAYFVSEGAMYHNAVGVDAVAPGKAGPQSWWDEVTSPTAKTVFADASSSEGGFSSSPYGTRTTTDPVLPGDFVNLGNYAAGTKLDFFLMANGADQSWSPIYSTDPSLNNDGFSQHVAAFTTHIFAVPQLNSPYLFLTFEDQWAGGDHDINDTIIALDVGTATVNSLLATPEPAMPLTFAVCLGLALIAVRKNKQAVGTV